MATSYKHPDVVDIPGAIGALWRELRLAAAFLTCLPLAPRPPGTAPGTVSGAGTPAPAGDAAAPPPAAMLRATALFPLVGAGIGIAAALALLGSFELGLHPLACALVALATAAVITGALHEDGLADLADGLGARGTREDRLAILRDSRIGTYGTLAVVFGVGLRASILGGMSSPDVAAAAVVAAASVSRAMLPAMLRWQRPARTDGLAAGIGVPSVAQVTTAAVLALAVCVLAVGLWATLAVGIAAVLATLAVAGIAQRMLGGHTGDVLGAAQVIAELAILAAIAIIE